MGKLFGGSSTFILLETVPLPTIVGNDHPTHYTKTILIGLHFLTVTFHAPSSQRYSFRDNKLFFLFFRIHRIFQYRQYFCCSTERKTLPSYPLKLVNTYFFVVQSYSPKVALSCTHFNTAAVFHVDEISHEYSKYSATAQTIGRREHTI